MYILVILLYYTFLEKKTNLFTGYKTKLEIKIFLTTKEYKKEIPVRVFSYTKKKKTRK